MGIVSIFTDVPGQIGENPRRVKLITTDSLATITTAGYLNNASLQGYTILPTDILDVWYLYVSASSPGTFGMFTPDISNGVITLNAWENPGNVLLPVVDGDFANFNGTSGQIKDDGFSPTDATKTKVVMANGAVVANNIAIFTDVNGTIDDNLAALNTVATASATPGTIRSLVGVMTGSNATMTSGNLVGVRGEVDYVGASGGFLYGAQGKLIPTGTISGSSWNAGVFGQLDISAATINAAQMAPIWGDYGASSGTLTDQTGLYGIAMTNTTAVVTQGQIYLYGGSQNLLYLSTNPGLSGVTYFIDAGTSAGSWGNATPPTPSKVLRISVDGTQYYLPLVAQNT